MEKIFNAASIVTGIAGGLIASMFGAWDKLLWALMVVMVLDYISGIVKAIRIKKLSSKIGFEGLLKKIMILIIAALSNVAQELMGGSIAIREIVIMFYIANEGISILENAAVLLPNTPEKLKDILLQLRGDNNENRN